MRVRLPPGSPVSSLGPFNIFSGKQIVGVTLRSVDRKSRRALRQARSLVFTYSWRGLDEKQQSKGATAQVTKSAARANEIESASARRKRSVIISHQINEQIELFSMIDRANSDVAEAIKKMVRSSSSAVQVR